MRAKNRGHGPLPQVPHPLRRLPCFPWKCWKGSNTGQTRRTYCQSLSAWWAASFIGSASSPVGVRLTLNTAWSAIGR